MAGLEQIYVDPNHWVFKRQHTVIIGTTELPVSTAARRPTALLLKR